jgi:hypothetical protein
MEKFARGIIRMCGTFTDPVTRNLMMNYFGVEELDRFDLEQQILEKSLTILP